MIAQQDTLQNLIHHIILKGIQPLVVEKDTYALIKDPVFGIARNRVIAEILKALLRINVQGTEHLPEKLAAYLCQTQNADGSWNEIHPNYDQPSALITSIVGEALLMIHQETQDKKIKHAVDKAVRYVTSQGNKNGYFLKSEHYTADHLNVDATCGAFLSTYGHLCSDENCIDLARQTAKHICRNQCANGSYPYTIDRGNYSQILDIPCIHYQGVTLFYLSKIHSVIQEDWLQNNLEQGAKWLVSTQKANGTFDWSQSGLLLSYYLTGAYAFSYASLIYVSQWNNTYNKHAEGCLKVFQQNVDHLALRWERETWWTFPTALVIALKTSLIGNYPVKHRCFRLGYALYRQYARRGLTTAPLKDPLFKMIVKSFRMNYSVIESSRNFYDLFMTSESLDCFTQSLQWRCSRG